MVLATSLKGQTVPNSAQQKKKKKKVETYRNYSVKIHFIFCDFISVTGLDVHNRIQLYVGRASQL
jgi:hypothetical protein